jgi:hypothetical protein
VSKLTSHRCDVEEHMDKIIELVASKGEADELEQYIFC